MLDPDKAHAWIEHHFDTVTDEDFIANVRRLDPEFAEELWGRPCAAANAGNQRLDGLRGFFMAFGRSVQRLFT
jgi:hypothetical protein